MTYVTNAGNVIELGAILPNGKARIDRVAYRDTGGDFQDATERGWAIVNDPKWIEAFTPVVRFIGGVYYTEGQANSLCDYCDLEEHTNCEGEGCGCPTCFPDRDPRHAGNCICADCSGAELTADND